MEAEGWTGVAARLSMKAIKKRKRDTLDDRRIVACTKRRARFDDWLAKSVPFGPGIASVEDWVQACDGLQVAIAEDAMLSKYLSGSVLTGPSLADAQFAAFEVHRRLFSSPAPLPRVTHRTRRFPAIRSDTFHRHSPLPASEGPQSVSARQLHLGHPPPRCVPHLFVCVSVHFQLARS